MDQMKIGKFIANCRKELNMTQLQVAEKLGVTNRAVSKWETGKSIPDVSIMLELCEILNISVNELICGQRLSEADEKKKLEENALTIVGTKKELENLKILSEILIFIGIIIATTLTAVLAVTTLQRLITIGIGSFVWGYGIWMRVKLGKLLMTIR